MRSFPTPGRLGVIVLILLGCANVVASPSAIEAGASSSPSLILSPTPASGTHSWFNDVSCNSRTMCMAVGTRSQKRGPAALAELWNGRSWSITGSSKKLNVGLGGIACPGATFCIAVGSVGPPATAQPLAELWNGSGWQESRVPLPSGTDISLNSVACSSPRACVAVGQYYTSIRFTFSEIWNGAKWHLVATDNPSTVVNALANVSCTSAHACQAVGYDASGQGAPRPLVESWSGGAWSVSPTPILPNPIPDGPPRSGILTGVSCTLATACVAVGYASAPGDTTLVESWNGSVWSISPSPNPDSVASELNGVSCTNANFCLAVGTESNNQTSWSTLAELWNGAAWTAIPSADPGALDNSLVRVSCPTPTTCRSVGSTSDATLAESESG